jgi:hypothetical protein
MTAGGQTSAPPPRGASGRATGEEHEPPRGGGAPASAAWRAPGNQETRGSGEGVVVVVIDHRAEDRVEKLRGRSRSLVGRRCQLHKRRSAEGSSRLGGGGLDASAERRYSFGATAGE